MRWEQVVAPAEQLAQFSPGISRALVQDLTAFGGRLAPDSEARRRFLGSGTPAVGAVVGQPELAATLSILRRQGVGASTAGRSPPRLPRAPASTRGSCAPISRASPER
jgi:gamma-glutamyltranspeptidase/glutathione hydrolase